MDIPEILINISAKCDRSTNAALARVCRTWSDFAVEQLWSALPSLLPLLRVLLPLVVIDGALVSKALIKGSPPNSDPLSYSQDFDQEAGQPNWPRFWALASRVREFEQYDGPGEGIVRSPTQLHGRISPNVIPYLLVHLPWTGQQFLLPKLTTLQWSVSWEHSMHQLCHFMSPTLRNLIIHLDDSLPADRAVRTLHSLASLPLKITTLCIGTSYESLHPDLQVASAIALFVKAQPTLETLSLANLWSRGEFVDGSTQYTSLLALELYLHYDTLSELGGFLELVARQCPRLQRFIYTLPNTFPPLTPRCAIEPLLSCSMLRDLQIFHQSRLSVDSDDIKRMGQAWRHMEVLQLSSGGIADSSVDTPLLLLLEFAEEFSPHLRHLALNFSCGQELPLADVVWASFPNLEVLGVGRSKPGAKALVTGEFLASVCPEQTKLAYTCDYGFQPEPFDTVTWKEAPEASDWVEVAAVMDCVRRVQKVALAKAPRA